MAGISADAGTLGAAPEHGSTVHGPWGQGYGRVGVDESADVSAGGSTIFAFPHPVPPRVIIGGGCVGRDRPRGLFLHDFFTITIPENIEV